jgi:hypothetical protein
MVDLAGAPTLYSITVAASYGIYLGIFLVSGALFLILILSPVSSSTIKPAILMPTLRVSFTYRIIKTQILLLR